MKAIDVKSKKWLQDPNYPIRVLFDDGEYSIIWGKYMSSKSLGVRYNIANTEKGYPVGRGGPEWYVEPDFLAIIIVQQLITLSVENNEYEYLDNIKFALDELTEKLRK